MNLLITAKTNQLPFIKLKLYCSRLHNSLRTKERIKLEQQLWAEVKLLRDFKNKALLTYLIGFYHTILYQLATQPTIEDPFQYHVLIRLGDLNRYLQRDEIAEYYYSNARTLYPLYGHAYNQLGLVLANRAMSENYYKCCYCYARAAKSSDKSMTKTAESNLVTASRSNKADILNLMLNDGAHQDSDDVDTSSGDDHVDTKVRTFPKSAIDWFYLMVVAISIDSIQPIAVKFLYFTKENFSTQKATFVRDNIRWTSIYCDRDSYLLLATLDILLDWIKLSVKSAKLLDLVSGDLRKMRTCLQSTLASIRYESSLNQNFIRSNSSHVLHLSSTDTTDSSQNGSQSTLHDCSSSNLNTSSSSACSATSNQRKSSPALPHDYVLRGFKPLDEVHEEISFCDNIQLIDLIHRKVFGLNTIVAVGDDDVAKNDRFIECDQLKQILLRITGKMEAFGCRIKKRTRNIALDSILSNMN